MDLQSNLIESNRQPQKGRWQASITSMILHGLLVAAIIFLGATATHRVDAEDKIRAFISEGAAPPPPPPPPPAPALSSGALKATPRIQPKIEPKPVPHDAFIPPREIPKEVPKVELPSTTRTEDVKPSNDTPAQLPGAVEGGVANGVPGGVVGGVQGGVVGGETGGVVGGQIGGVKGGEVGGKVGGTGSGTEGDGKAEKEVAKPEPVPDGPVRVGGDVKAPTVIDRVEPKYTETARTARVTGVVIVEAIIDKTGKVDQVKVLKGLPMGLSEEAEQAVRKWKFRPGTMNGQPVDVIFDLTVNFKLGS
ncbi:MAG TPA: energy transducer TonB [Thermoanaerobaculia bacterium]